jgi:hypothetical protein
MKQGLIALLQGVGQLAAQGGDPLPYLRAAATILDGRKAGKDLDQLMLKAFDPQTLHPQPPAGAAPADQAGGAPPPEASAPGAQDPTGQGGPPAPPGVAPGGPVPLQMLVAGMRNGNPQMQAAVSRRLPATG